MTFVALDSLGVAVYGLIRWLLSLPREKKKAKFKLEEIINQMLMNAKQVMLLIKSYTQHS